MTDEEKFNKKMKEIAECRERIKERKCEKCPKYLKEECTLPPSIRKRLFPE